ncbi:hypothetical protein D3C71_1010380 [compost metagenome]
MRPSNRGNTPSMRWPSRVRISKPKRERAVSNSSTWRGAGAGAGSSAQAAWDASASRQPSSVRTTAMGYGHQKAVRLATPGSMLASRSKASTAMPPGGMPR